MSNNIKVKMIFALNSKDFEDNINNFIKSSKVKIYDIKYSINDNAFTGMIIYEEIKE